MSVRTVIHLSPELGNSEIGGLLDAQGEPGAAAAASVVCGYAEGTINMTAALWQRVLAEHKRLGRMLTDAELQAVCSGEGGDRECAKQLTSVHSLLGVHP